MGDGLLIHEINGHEFVMSGFSRCRKCGELLAIPILSKCPVPPKPTKLQKGKK